MLRVVFLAKVASANFITEDALLGDDYVSLLHLRAQTENKLDPGAPGWDASPYKGKTGWENLGQPYTWRKDTVPKVQAFSDLDEDWPEGWHAGIIPERWKSGWRPGFAGSTYGGVSPNRFGGYTKTKEECAQQCASAPLVVNSAQWATPEMADFLKSGWKSSPQAASKGQGWIDSILRSKFRDGRGRCDCLLCWKPTPSDPASGDLELPGSLTLGPEDLYSPYPHGMAPFYDGIRISSWKCKYEADFDPVCGYSTVDDEGGCVQEAEEADEADEASALGDPHVSTNSGAHVDMELPAVP